MGGGNSLGQVAEVARGVVEGAEGEDDEGGVREHRQPGEACDHVVPVANVLGVDRQWPPDELEELESVDSNLRGDQDPPDITVNELSNTQVIRLIVLVSIALPITLAIATASIDNTPQGCVHVYIYIYIYIYTCLSLSLYIYI